MQPFIPAVIGVDKRLAAPPTGGRRASECRGNASLHQQVWYPRSVGGRPETVSGKLPDSHKQQGGEYQSEAEECHHKILKHRDILQGSEGVTKML